MKKRIFSALLVLALILTVCAVGIVAASADGNTATIRVGGREYTAQVGDFVEYRAAFTYSGNKLATAQIEVPIDFTAFNGYTKSELTTHMSRIAPATASASVVERFDGDGTLGINGYVMNFVSAGGYDFKSQTIVLSLLFGVEKAGTYDISAKVRYVEDVSDNVVVDSNYQVLDNRFSFSEELVDGMLDTPKLSASTYVEGMMVRWDPVPKAALYRVFRKTNNGWAMLGDTAGTSYLDPDVVTGNRYTYTVRCLNAAASKYTSDFDHNGQSAVYYAAPSLRLSNAEAGVLLQWDAVPQAVKYRLFYKNNQGIWTKLTDDVTGASFLDTEVSSGNSYTYTIRAINANGSYMTWYYPDGFRIQYISPPVMTLSNTEDGVKISWTKPAGSTNYRVYSRSGSSGWTRIGDTADSYLVDKNVKSGVTYTYTVRCINDAATAFTSYFNTAGKSITYYAAPQLRLSNAENGVLLQWDAIPGAAKYRLFYKNSQGGWTKIIDTTAVSYLDKNVTSGSSYTYTARAIAANGSYLSRYYPDGFRIQYISPPVFSLSNIEDGVKISWAKPAGSTKYRVYCRNSSGGWTRVGDTADNYLVDKNVRSGSAYTYTVRCINDAATAFTSYFNTAGKSITYYAAPIISTANAVNGVNLKWTAVTGAAKYRLFSKNNQGGWTKIIDTTAASYLDQNVTSGTSYTYTARAIAANGSYLTSYYPNGFTIRYISPPVITLSNIEDGVKISWAKPAGSTNYRVFVRSSSGGWTRIGDTADNSFIDRNVVTNRTYTYTVRCINDAGTAYTSNYLGGKSINYYAAPQLQLSNTANGVSLKWNDVKGAAKYRLFYKNDQGGWTKITDTTATSYLDQTVQNGVAYTYTARAIAANGSYLTWYYPNGFTITYNK